MRILCLTTSYPTPDAPESGIFVARLVQALKNHAAVDLLVPSTPASGTEHCPPREAEATNRREFRYAPRSLETLANRPGGVPAALRESRWNWLLVPGFLISYAVNCLVAARRVDVILANWAIAAIVARPASLLWRRPIVLTLRGADVNDGVDQGRAAGLILRCALHCARQVIVVDSAMRERVTGAYPKHVDKIHYIPNGVDDMFWALGAERSGLRHSRSTLRVVTIGSLIPRKRMADVIAGCQGASASGSTELRIVGQGPLGSQLERQAGEATTPSLQVSLVGPCRPSAIVQHYCWADVLVLASAGEGRANVLIEAMAARTPVIVTDIHGSSALVQAGQTGWSYPVADVAALANCIEAARDTVVRERLADAAHARVKREHGSWDDCAQRYLQVMNMTVSWSD